VDGSQDGNPVPATAGTPAVPSCRQLFVAFMRIGVTGVGGVLPQAQHELVEVRRWLTQREFAELLSLGQMLPGPNVGNVSIMLGNRFHGAAGSFACLAGLLGVPFFVVLAIAALYHEYGAAHWVQPFFRGIAAGVGGLVFGTGLRLLRAQPRAAWVPLIAGAAFVLVAVLRAPLMPVVLGLAPFAAAFAWRWMVRSGALR